MPAPVPADAVDEHVLSVDQHVQLETDGTFLGSRVLVNGKPLENVLRATYEIAYPVATVTIVLEGVELVTIPKRKKETT